MTKRKISFEVSDSWTIYGFRNFVKVLLSDEESFEVFIISSDSDVSRVSEIGSDLGLDSDHIISCSSTADKINAIISNEIDIHLDNIYRVVESVDVSTDAVGILVNSMWNSYHTQLQYIVDFDTALDYLQDLEDNGS